MKKSHKRRISLKKTKKKSCKKGGARSPSRKSRSPSRKSRSPSRKAKLSPRSLAKIEEDQLDEVLAKIEGDQLDKVLALSLITTEEDQLREARKAQSGNSKDALAEAREIYKSSKGHSNIAGPSSLHSKLAQNTLPKDDIDQATLALARRNLKKRGIENLKKRGIENLKKRGVENWDKQE